MNVPWMNLRQFLTEEQKYGVILKVEQYKAMCVQYGFVQATNGWVSTEEVPRIPNLASKIMHPDAPDIRTFFSNYYSFKDKEGEVYWVVTPCDCVLSKEEVAARFKANRIICDVMDGFYGDYAIVMKPKQLLDACNDYVVKPSDRRINQFSLYQVNVPLSLNIELQTFDTKEEALAFKAGMDFACQTFLNNLN